MSEKSKIYCFTKYSAKGPSSRYRTFQFLPFWSQFYEIEVHSLLGDWYFDKQSNLFKKGRNFLISFFNRLKILQKAGPNDMVWIEYELFPYLGSFAERTLKKKGIPFILDYDDAIFHWYGNHSMSLIRRLMDGKIEKLISMASAVVTGSPYLTKYAKKYHLNTIEIPTSINPDNYLPIGKGFQNKPENCLVIGWLGSRTTSKNLAIIKEAFSEFTKEFSAELWLMGYDENLQDIWKGLPVKFFQWSAEEEIKFLRTIDVGIMPLYVNDFNKGKCGFKLIQYMAMGKPTISTPLEANKKIDRARINFFAETAEEWIACFKEVEKQIINTDYAINRGVIEQYYNAKLNEVIYREIFEKI